MADDRANEPQDEHQDEALEAPIRGSADELLDAGAHAPIDAMRHSAAHVMAEAVLDLFPRTASTTTSTCRAR
jgi:threonyl-tRNA synthetase